MKTYQKPPKQMLLVALRDLANMIKREYKNTNHKDLNKVENIILQDLLMMIQIWDKDREAETQTTDSKES